MQAPENLTQLALTMRYTALRTQLFESERLSNIDGPEVDSVLSLLTLRHHFRDGWSADAQLPIGLVRLSPANTNSTGRVAGFGDLKFGLRYDLASLWGRGGYNPTVTVRAALALPSGKTNKIVISGVPPSQLGIGRGAFSIGGDVTATQFVHRSVALVGYASINQPLSANEAGFVYATSLAYGFGATWLADEQLNLRGQIEGTHRGSAEVIEVGEIINSGGNLLAATVSAGWRATEGLSFSATGRVPFWAKVNGTQVSETFSIVGTVAVSFGGKDPDDHEEDDHGHDHGHGHEAKVQSKPASNDADVTDAATGGQSFTVADVVRPGKVTVIDFWADWCPPCKEITAMLDNLASTHADLAVRRVEVPDFNGAVAREHLDGVAALPVVWIYDRESKRVAVMVGTNVADVRARILAELTPASK